jgi:hypothetical protein
LSIAIKRINKIKNFKRILFGFKLYLITNEKGEIISFYLSKAKKMIMIYPYLNHFALRIKLLIKANRMAYDELQKLRYA